ncbi:MAG: hydroxymethylbilane synthase [Candidatus Eisenbacteria bacterium]|uniref:Hydroxymethylbilane synthase n=1 Tax=Eiseniibacteriota bacterium TaxID=2212470 RepID=A0A9D6LAZ0_UNCEI|nr:hydroxymethylbilane synthase [Candidatus Eisenbacteria bacterium]MBI3540235.1 hydroxymethylbilane synthase [Candidatus Eisenbacteria bacterium]
MTLPTRLRIGVRANRLALALADEIVDALQTTHPSLTVELVKIAGSGDHVHDGPAAGAAFTRELDAALADGRVDAALHDMPDLPLVRLDSYVLAAVPRRRHPFEVFVTADGRILDELDEGERVGASTALRRAQVLAYREDLKVVGARGGLETHWNQITERQFEGLVMAATDAERLGWHDRVSEIFTTEVCVPAPGQGAIALEALVSRKDVLAALKTLDDPDSHRAVVAERAWLNELGGGDDLPAGALANAVDGRLVMEAVLVSADGLEIVRDEIEGPIAQAETLGVKLAVRMLERGGQEIVEASAGERE